MDKVRVAPFDADSMTMGEADDFEAATGWPVARLYELIDKKKNPPMKITNVLIWFTLRREDPTVTLQQVRDMPLGSIEWVKNTDPTNGADTNGNGSVPSAPPSDGAPPQSSEVSATATS